MSSSVLLLALQLLVEEGRDLGIGGAQGGFVGESGARGDARTDLDMCAGHCDLCPSVVVAGKPPRSESNAVALIGPSRSTRGVVVVQSMIVEASPAEATTVDDDVDLGTECGCHPGRGVRGRLTMPVGAGRGKRPGEPEQLERDRVIRDADAECRALARDGPAPAAERAHDRERSRPVPLGQGSRRRTEVDVGLDVGHRRGQERQLEPVGPALDGVDAAHRSRARRVAGEPIHRVGGDRDHATATDGPHGVLDAHAIATSSTRVRPVRSGTGTMVAPGKVALTRAVTASA